MPLSLSNLALRDLEQISRYTAERWGIRQARKYVRQIEVALEEMESGKQRGRPFFASQRALRRVLVGRHHLYFEAASDLTFVSRILHGAMDVQHLEFPGTEPTDLE